MERGPPARAGLSPGLGSLSQPRTAGAALGAGPGAAWSQPHSLLLPSRERRAPAGATGDKGGIGFPFKGGTEGKGGIGFRQQRTRRAHAGCRPAVLLSPGAWDGAHPLPPPAPSPSGCRKGPRRAARAPHLCYRAACPAPLLPLALFSLAGQNFCRGRRRGREGGRNPMQPLGARPRSAAPKINRREGRAAQCPGSPSERQAGCS